MGVGKEVFEAQLMTQSVGFLHVKVAEFLGIISHTLVGRATKNVALCTLVPWSYRYRFSLSQLFIFLSARNDHLFCMLLQ